MPNLSGRFAPSKACYLLSGNSDSIAAVRRSSSLTYLVTRQSLGPSADTRAPRSRLSEMVGLTSPADTNSVSV